MHEQINHACGALAYQIPDGVGVFLFDHSSGHDALASDARNATVLKTGDKSLDKKYLCQAMIDGSSVMENV